MKENAFTLIELLICIAIIALLAAILFPVFSQIRLKSYESGCQSNLKQLGMAISMYCQDHDDKYPICVDGENQTIFYFRRGEESVENILRNAPTLKSVLKPYTKNEKIWKCPADVSRDGKVFYTNFKADPLYFNKASLYDAIGTSYSYNSMIATDGGYLHEAQNRFYGSSEIPILSDTMGSLHSGKVQSGDYDEKLIICMYLFADNHVKKYIGSDCCLLELKTTGGW